MVRLLVGGLRLVIVQDLPLTESETAVALSLWFLSGALLRVVAGWSSDWFGAKLTGICILLGESVVALWGWLTVQSYVELLTVWLGLGVGGSNFAMTVPPGGFPLPLFPGVLKEWAGSY